MIYKSLSAKALQLAKKIQNRELTEAAVLEKLSKRQSLEKDRLALATMAEEDRDHEQMLKKYTGVSGRKSGATVSVTLLMARVFGYTFTVKFIEFLQARGQDKYGQLILEIPEAKDAAESNQKHKEILNDMLNSGSMDATADAASSVTKMTVIMGAALAAMEIILREPRKAAVYMILPGLCFIGVNCIEAYLSAFNARAGAAGKRTVRMLAGQLVAMLALYLPGLLISANYVGAVIATVIVGLVIILVTCAYTSIVENSYFSQRFIAYAAGLIVAAAVLTGGLTGIIHLFS